MVQDISADPNDATQALLQVIAHSLNHSLFPESTSQPPSWEGPTRSVVWTQCILYASLSASLLAAFGAMLGKQWLSYYARVGERGPPDARCKSRQQKLYGITRWHFRGVIELLPLLLQASLLLFGVGMSSFIGGIIVGATSAGVLFYIIIVIAALLSSHCPYQTPIASSIMSLWHTTLRAAKQFPSLHTFKHSVQMAAYDFLRAPIQLRAWIDQDRRRGFIEAHLSHLRTGQNYLTRGLLRPILSLRYIFMRLLEHFSTNASKDASANLSNIFTYPTPPQSDAMAVAWVLETVTEPVTTLIATQMVPEVDWLSQMDVFPLFCQLSVSLADLLLSGAASSTRPETLALVTANAKAWAHIYIGRLVLDDDMMSRMRDQEVVLRLEGWLYDLPSTTSKVTPLQWIPDLVKIHRRLMYGSEMTLQSQNLYVDPITRWTAHSIPLAMYHRSRSGAIPENEFESLCRALGNHVSLPKAVVADLLIAAGIVLGVRFSMDDLLKADKSQELNDILGVVLLESISPTNISSRSLTLLGIVHSVHLEQWGFEPLFACYAKWCLLLSRHFASLEQQPHFRYLHNLNLVHFHGDATAWALRLSVESALGQSGYPVHATERMWNMTYLTAYPAHFGSMSFTALQSEYDDLRRWILAFAYNLKQEYESSTIPLPENQREALQIKIADAALAFSGLLDAQYCAEVDPTDPRLLEFISWAMKSDKPMYLRVHHTALRLLRACLLGPQSRFISREGVPVPFRAALVQQANEGLFQSLRTLTQRHDHGEYDIFCSTAFLFVVHKLSNFSPIHLGPLFDQLIPSCVDILLAQSKCPVLEDGFCELRRHFVKVFIVQGLIPTHHAVRESIKDIHELIWKELCLPQVRLRLRSYHEHPVIPHLYHEVTHPEFDRTETFRFRPRLKAAIDWLKYCSEQFVSGNVPEIHPLKYTRETLERDARIMRDALQKLQEVERAHYQAVSHSLDGGPGEDGDAHSDFVAEEAPEADNAYRTQISSI
ncbi:hypothetical protein HGRIS_010100 [Hohenbuehelia grisea]|uniref:DUF6535 domain-containing protein n=1 Tax=Hohenbuehelia grisea TaxID=104357 RepID=A0ABR3J395_9AGAR